MADERVVIGARRRVVNALHAMHLDQAIHVSQTLANEIDAAWSAYDRAVCEDFERHMIRRAGLERHGQDALR